MFHKLYDDFSKHSSLAPARDKHITNFPYIAHVSPGTRVLDAFQFTVTFEQQFDVALFVIKLLNKSNTFLFFIGKLSKQSTIFTISILQLLLKPLLPVIMYNKLLLQIAFTLLQLSNMHIFVCKLCSNFILIKQTILIHRLIEPCTVFRIH